MFENVLLYSEGENGKTMIGMPTLDNVKVEARVMGNEKGEKIRVFKMSSKKRTQRTVGSRPHFTRLKILKISLLSGSVKAAKEEVEEPAVDVKKTAAPKKAPAKKKAAAKA